MGLKEQATCVIAGASVGAVAAYWLCHAGEAGACAVPPADPQADTAACCALQKPEETAAPEANAESAAAPAKEPVRSTTSTGGKPGGGPAIYESARAVNEYLAFHFLDPKVLMPYSCGPKDALDFTKRCADLCKKRTGRTCNKVLDLGCATGGQSFELARHFKEVLGLDYSHAFVEAAVKMQETGKATITMMTEGELMVEKEVAVPGAIDRKRVRFMQGDACALPEAHFGPFDCVLCANLLCRLPAPMRLLERLPSLVRSGGIVVFVSPYSWLLEYTPKDKWLGGLEVDGEPVHSADTLKQLMNGLPFELVEEQDMPFMIREHARKFQWGVSHATVWRRKPDPEQPLN